MGHYLITGAAGFIAWKVCERLLAEGHTVVGVDNLNDAYDVRLKEWRLAQLGNHARFKFHRLDICDLKGLRQVFNPQFDAVINLAARAGVRQSVKNPWVYVETNVMGTLNLLELCREYDVKKLVMASTSSLYGAKNPRPFNEGANTDGPLSPYAASKKGAEAMCYSYHYLYGIDVSVLRFFTVYGPAGRPEMSVFRFVQWISEERPVVVYGDGTQERDYTYVEDVAQGVLAALKPVGYEIINLGSDDPIVLNEAIRVVEELVGKEAHIVYEPGHPADVPATWADIGKAERLLGWRPRTRFVDGMARAVAWYRENREWAREIATD